MKLSALGYLSCVHCSGVLELQPDHVALPDDNSEVIAGTLRCRSCQRQFAIERAVPRLVDEAVSSTTDIRTGLTFAQAWKTFPRMDERYRRQFFDWVNPVDPDFLKGKLVLECGCGKGRHAKIVSECGASAVFAVDIGEAVDVAYDNVGRLPGVHVVQADIENLPFNRDFDFAFSVGVLHHMESPIKGFLSMSSKIRGDGSVCAWVYGLENNWWIIRIINPVRLAITSKLKPATLKVVSFLVAAPLFALCRWFVLPWKAARQKFHQLPPLFYEDYLAYIARFDFTEVHHIVFDHLAAPVANYVARQYFETWFEEAGFRQPIIRWHNRNSWTGFSSHNPEIMSSMRSKLEPDHSVRSELQRPSNPVQRTG